MTDKTVSNQSNPTTPATRSGKKYIHSSVGSAEQRGFKKAPTVITPGTSSKRSPKTTVAPLAPLPQQITFRRDSMMMMPFGDLPVAGLGLTTLTRIAKLLSQQSEKKVHPCDVILKRCLLANPADNLRLSKLLSDSYKGDSKPQEEEVDLGDQSVLGTLHWRTKVSTGGHLTQNMKGTDRDINSRSFAWAVLLISVWPPRSQWVPMPWITSCGNSCWETRTRSSMPWVRWPTSLIRIGTVGCFSPRYVLTNW